MLKQIIFGAFQRFRNPFTKKNETPSITEHTRLCELAQSYPQFELFLKTHHRIAITKEMWQLTLKQFVAKHHLASPQIIFMELQLFSRSQKIRTLSASEVKARLEKLQVLDVREPWEKKIGSLPTARDLDDILLKEILESWPRDKAILLYCHFGIRSEDAGSYFMEQGFEEVYVLKGGIDAWSKEVDPSIPQYEQAWC